MPSPKWRADEKPPRSLSRSSRRSGRRSRAERGEGQGSEAEWKVGRVSEGEAEETIKRKGGEVKKTTDRALRGNLKALGELLASIGCQLEQDNGGRFEVWQCVAHHGCVWNEGCKHIRLEWMPGVSTSAAAKRDAVIDATKRVLRGFRPMTEQEHFECDE